MQGAGEGVSTDDSTDGRVAAMLEATVFSLKHMTAGALFAGKFVLGERRWRGSGFIFVIGLLPFFIWFFPGLKELLSDMLLILFPALVLLLSGLDFHSLRGDAMNTNQEWHFTALHFKTSFWIFEGSCGVLCSSAGHGMFLLLALIGHTECPSDGVAQFVSILNTCTVRPSGGCLRA